MRGDPSGDPFEVEEQLREALEEVAEAPVGAYVEEPWGSAAVEAAKAVARGGRDAALVRLAAAALERVAASSELRELQEDEAAWLGELDDVRRRLG